MPLPPNSKKTLPSYEKALSPNDHHHNALRQIGLEHGSLTIRGFSISGLSSYLQIPELDLCFDMGECPLTAVGLNHVFLTHAHGDHSRCLMRHDSLRKMMGVTKPAQYYIPECIHQEAQNWIYAEARFEGVSKERFQPPEIIAVSPDQWIPLTYRKDLQVKGFKVKHSLPSLGYTIAYRKNKLKKEYLSCTSQEIIDLRKKGIAITQELLDHRVTYIGDCIGDSLKENPDIWNSEILILEATFLDPDEHKMARKKGHTHLDEIIGILQEREKDISCQKIILKHFSMKYPRWHILKTLEKKIPAAFQDRVIALI